MLTSDRKGSDMWRPTIPADRTREDDEKPRESQLHTSASSVALSTPLSPPLNNLGQNSRIKFVVLILLCCQNAGHALLARYSQGVLKETYSSTGMQCR